MRTHFLLVVCAISACWCRLAEETEQTEDPCTTTELNCYHKPPEACPPADQKCSCKIDACKKAVICCDVDAFRLAEGLGCANVNVNTGDISAIHIRNATLDTLNLTQFITWRRLTSMSITDGRISNVTGEFGKHSYIQCLNLSSNGITKFGDRSLVNLHKLSILDLSHNNLSDVPRFQKKGTVRLDISDNQPMLCTNLYEAIKKPELQFDSSNETWCLSSKTFHWFNSTELVPLVQLERFHQVKEDCTKNCSCQPIRLDIVPGKPPTFAVSVDCFNQQFTELPIPLPPNTIALNISNNNITSLKAVKDPSYSSLRQLYADNNEIETITPLEGTHFLTNFVALSLKNNKLKSVPTYILSNIFDRNYNSRLVHLGLNKLTCDCTTAKDLKVWLLTKQKHIPDFDKIECENMEAKVFQLEVTKLCQSPHDWTDYIYYIITAEVLLLVFLIVKVTYDYWVFKTVGYLPWPASKMPKLPCDWLCE